MNQETLLYTHSDEAYGHFVIPFMYFALMADESYSVEVWAEDSGRHKANAAKLNELFGGRSLLVNTDSQFPAVDRFREQPKTSKSYTYISDIDIMTLDPHIRERHVANLDSRCYSNAMRDRLPIEEFPRLTGLMFVITDEWYAATEAARKLPFEGSDEMILAQIAFSVFPETKAELEEKGCILHVEKSGPKTWVRPVHGIHMSIARDPRAKIGWELKNRWLNALKRIEKHETWPEFWSMTDDKWKQEYNKIKLGK